MTPSSKLRLQQVMDFGERAISLVLFAAFIVRIGRSLSTEPYNAIVAVSETMVMFFILIRRPAQFITDRPADWVLGFLGTILPMMLNPGGHPVAPPLVGTTIMFAGLGLVVWAKLTLRRSFGLVAANRGVVQVGPYRIIRHPMYAGYFVVHFGFLLNNPIVFNVGIIVCTLGLQVARILAEEKVLTADPVYAALIQRVRYRLAPGLF